MIGLERFITMYTSLNFTYECKMPDFPIKKIPMFDIKIDYMEDIIRREEEYAALYIDYTQAKLEGVITKRLEQFKKELHNISEEAWEKFCDNGDKYILLNTIIASSKKGFLEKEYKRYIEDFLKNSLRGDKEAVGYELSPELLSKHLVDKMRQCLKAHNIIIKAIIFPKGFETFNCGIYPIKLTYRYVLIGIEKGSLFEKEIIQKFYIGYDWSEGVEKGRDIIEYMEVM